MMDRGYIDFGRLHAFTRQLAFFVTRAKKNLDCYRRESRVVDKSTGLRSDQTIVLQGTKTSQLYPDPLRRVAYFDAEHDRRLVFLTNNFELPALTIAQLYRCRWQVELFFKWIKQNLRIKAFYGNSVNAVKTQVWIAVSVYVLVAILRKELKLECTARFSGGANSLRGLGLSSTFATGGCRPGSRGPSSLRRCLHPSDGRGL